MKIDSDYVLECLKTGDYQKAIKYLDYMNIHEDTRFGNQLVKIIATMNRINGFNKYEYPNEEYTMPKEKSVSRFYEALRHKDFIEASKLVDDAIDYLKSQYRDYEEMQVFKEVLVYAVDVQQRAILRANNIPRMSELTHEIEVYTRSTKEIKDEDLYWLLDRMDEIVYLSQEIDRDSNKMKFASEIIYTILDFSDGAYRDVDYFGDVTEYGEKNKILNRFYKQLMNGQYPSAFSTLKRYINSSNKKLDWTYKLYYMLLNRLNGILTAYKPEDDKYIVHNQSEEIDYDKLYEDVLENKEEKDVDLLANLVLVRSLKK